MTATSRIKCIALLAIGYCNVVFAQQSTLSQQAEQAMLKATRFMSENVSTNGGYVWYYLPDLSRRWGEMEAYKTMIWVQDGGTVSVGHMLLDAYETTGNEYFYQQAERAGAAMIWGQSNEGGWNYLIDFAGDRSLKKWYATIGKNAWRLEEFQHYYGNSTYDDDVTSDAARFLLRLYLQKLDPRYKPALDKAIDFVLKSQYPNGGWPQRYPLKHDFNKAGHPDYSSFYTFNDDVIWENVLFLIQCYETLGDSRFLEPIYKGMNFYLLVQGKNGAWGQQYNMNMQVAGARTYEPAGYVPRYTFNNCLLLLKFYQYTGDRKFLAHIPDAIKWLEKVRLPERMTQNGKYTHPLFVDPVTDKPMFVHRKGSNVIYGYYYKDTSDANLLSHMPGKSNLDLQHLKTEYAKISALSPKEASQHSPLIPAPFDATGTPQAFYHLSRVEHAENEAVSETRVKAIIDGLDSQNRWLVKHAMKSNPYAGDGERKEATDAYASTNVGDTTDTSPYRDLSDQEYISTPEYIRNMQVLISYLRSNNKASDKNVIWHLNDPKQVGGFNPVVLGDPITKVEGNDSSIYFNGITDGLVLPEIPLAGWSHFTIEVLFKPDSDGPVAPRFVHFEDSSLNRGTLELRLTKDKQWYLDGFLKNGKTKKGITLIDSTKLHPADSWHRVALVYDGKKMYTFIDGKKEGESDMDFPLVTKGNISLGVRLNKKDWFKGQIREVRFCNSVKPLAGI
ncbi:pectate lyase [Niastella yeongjuensis]|nr:pectate lyase [Niastella yeongjuensis]